MVSARRGWGTQGALQRNVFVRPRSGEPAPSGPQLGPLMRSVELPVRAGDQALKEPTLGPLRHSTVVRLRPGDPGPSGPPLGPVRSRIPGAHAHGNTERQVVDGLRTEVGGQQKQSNDPHNNRHNLNMPTTGRRRRANGTPCHIQHSPTTPTTGLCECGNISQTQWWPFLHHVRCLRVAVLFGYSCHFRHLLVQDQARA